MMSVNMCLGGRWDCVTSFESGAAVLLRRLSQVSRMSVEGATEDTADSI